MILFPEPAVHFRSRHTSRPSGGGGTTQASSPDPFFLGVAEQLLYAGVPGRYDAPGIKHEHGVRPILANLHPVQVGGREGDQWPGLV